MIIEFDDPQSVMHSDILNYLEVAIVDGLYQPPIPLDTFAKALRANPMHESAIEAKCNMITASCVCDTVISEENLKRCVTDYLIFGNAYFNLLKNKLGGALQIKHLPALYMRVNENFTGYTYKPKESSDEGEVDYKNDQVFHLKKYDVSQEIYGLPSYVSALISIWLSEDSTLFRRKYFINGSHAGYLLYIDDPHMSKEEEDEIKNQLKRKGSLAFKNLFFNGRGKGKEPKLIPINQVEAKDNFKGIKNQTMTDILICHRVPLELMSIQREGIGASGDLNKVDKIFYKNELVPVIKSLMSLNAFCGKQVISIADYQEL